MLRGLLGPVFANFRLKALALLISLGIWFYADTRLTQEVDAIAAVEVIPPDGYAQLFQSDPTVRLRIAGPSWLVSRLQNDLTRRILKLSYPLSESELADGWADLEIRPDWLKHGLPELEFVQLDFRSMEPKRIRVFVSPLVRRDLPVEVRTSGQPAAGFHLWPPPVSVPPEVTVLGPAVALDAMESVATEELPIRYLRANLSQDLPLKKQVEVTLDNDKRVDVLLKLSVSRVTANIHVTAEKEQERTFPDVPIELLALPGFAYVAVFEEGQDRVSVVIKASPQELRKLGPGSVRAFVDLTSLAEEELAVDNSRPSRESVRVLLPPDVRASEWRTEPELVTLTLKKPAE